jgi:hypothetical protein
MEPTHSKAAALRLATNVTQDCRQSHVPRDVFSAYSQWDTIEDDQIEQRFISGQSTISRAVQHFIDDLLQGIHQEFATAGNKFPAVMYADDLLLLWRTESEALSMWIFLQNWNSNNVMKLKLPKCSYVTLGERYSLLKSQGLSLQLTHKHLGIFLTARGIDC